MIEKESLINILLPYYIPGNRQALIFALSGFLKKKGVPREEVEKIAKELHRRGNDEDPLSQRLSAVALTYYKETDVLGWKGLSDFLSVDDLKRLEKLFQGNKEKNRLRRLNEKKTGKIPLEFSLNQLAEVLKRRLLKELNFIGYSPDIESWLIARDGLVWQKLSEEELLVFLRDLIEKNFLEIVKEVSGTFSNRLIKFLVNFLERGTYSNEILQTLQVLMALPSESVYGFPSLCLYSPGYKIEYSDPNKWVAKTFPTYQCFGTDPERKRPERFIEFLLRFFGDEDKVEFFRCILAYSLLPGAKRKIVFIVGEAGTGKSTLATILQEVFGKYAGVLPKGALIGQQADNLIQPHLEVLKYAKLIFIHELSGKDVLNSEKIKAITGGDVLSWRNPHSAKIHESRPEALLIVFGNSKPQFSTLDTAIAERVEFLFTKERVPYSQRKMDFAQEILSTEKGAILNWILEKLKYVQAHPYFWEKSPFKKYKIRELVLRDLCTGLWEFITTPDPKEQVELKEIVEVSLQVLDRLGVKEYFLKRFNIDNEERLRKSLETRFGIFVRNFNPSAFMEKRTRTDRIKLIMGYRLNKNILDELPAETETEEQTIEDEIPF